MLKKHMIKLGKVLSVNEKKRDLVLSVDWLGVLSVHLEPGPYFLPCVCFLNSFQKRF